MSPPAITLRSIIDQERHLDIPPLRNLHSDGAFSPAKLEQFRRLATSTLIESLQPGLPGALKTRPDGTIMDGHHRILVLRERGIEVDILPREILPKQES